MDFPKPVLEPIQKDSKSLHFLYHTAFGRLILKLLVAPWFSNAAGKYLDSSRSKKLISGFVEKNGINLEEYEPVEYDCFNSFFCRKIKSELRPLDTNKNHFMSPCDGLLSVYEITEGLVMPVKQSEYSVEDLLQDKELASEFKEGYCLVFRLCVNHYHRYHFCESGNIVFHKAIPGRLHTVRPIALRKKKVFLENSREFDVIETENSGKIVQMEVGAMLVGKIDNHFTEGMVQRGAEKGRFLYGGSTIIVLVQKDRIKLDPLYIEAPKKDCEVPVKMGQYLGDIL